jgi:Domain of unknown function (DUF4396)
VANHPPYAGPLGWWSYRRYGRLASPGLPSRDSRRARLRQDRLDRDRGQPLRRGLHAGDIVGEWLIFAIGLRIASDASWGEYIADYALAFVLGIALQYFSIAPSRGLRPREWIVAASKADTLSLTFFEVGLFGWMALAYFVLFPDPGHLRPASPAYWLLMQIGMLFGFATACPVNVWLIRRAIKEAM